MVLFGLEFPLVHGIEVGLSLQRLASVCPASAGHPGMLLAPSTLVRPSRSLSFTPVRARSLVMVNRMIVQSQMKKFCTRLEITKTLGVFRWQCLPGPGWTRLRRVELHKGEVYEDPQYRSRIHELSGKRLLCHPARANQCSLDQDTWKGGYVTVKVSARLVRGRQGIADILFCSCGRASRDSFWRQRNSSPHFSCCQNSLWVATRSLRSVKEWWTT